MWREEGGRREFHVEGVGGDATVHSRSSDSLARRIAASKNTEINTAVRKTLRLVLSEAPFFWNVRTPKFAKKVIYAADQEPTAQLYIPIDDLETFAQGHVKDFVKRVYMTNSATDTKTPKEFRSYLMRTYLFGTGLVYDKCVFLRHWGSRPWKRWRRRRTAAHRTPLHISVSDHLSV